jgi:4-hydroxythreonine-4-phosphate dehydrogenase
MSNGCEDEPMSELPIIAITMGDPAGIGPEIVAKALGDPATSARRACRPLVIGDPEALVAWCGVAVRAIDQVREATFEPGVLEVVRSGPSTLGVSPGEVSAVAGEAAVAAVRRACALARDDAIDGIATAPLNKEAMHLAGYPWPGHTELLADELDAGQVSLALGCDGLYVLHVTTHVALADACQLVTRERVTRYLRLAGELAAALGREGEEIAVLGLNPHAGESGLFGREDLDEIVPAIAQARAEGLTVSGPWPADAVLPQAFRGRYRLVVAMYHDQGHAPFKSVYGDRGVNVTVGLPIVRTSVDHGTAFDIAGRGIARAESMVAAIELAAALAPKWRAQWARSSGDRIQPPRRP